MGGLGGNGGGVEGTKTLYKYLKLRGVTPYANRLSIDYGVDDPELSYGQIYLGVIPAKENGEPDDDEISGYEYYVFPADRALVNAISYYGGVKGDSAVEITPGGMYVVKLGFLDYNKIEETQEIVWDQYIVVRTPQLYTKINLDSITPAGATTGGAITVNFTVSLDSLIDEAYVEVIGNGGKGTSPIPVTAANPAPATEAAGTARWKIDMKTATQVGQRFTFNYGANEELLIRIVDVKYGGKAYTLKSDLYINKLY